MLTYEQLRKALIDASERCDSVDPDELLHTCLRAVAEAAVKDAVYSDRLNAERWKSLYEAQVALNEVLHRRQIKTEAAALVPEQASAAVPEELVKAIQTAIRALDTDSGPMTREYVANGLRAMLAASQPEVSE